MNIKNSVLAPVPLGHSLGAHGEYCLGQPHINGRTFLEGKVFSWAVSTHCWSKKKKKKKSLKSLERIRETDFTYITSPPRWHSSGPGEILAHDFSFRGTESVWVSAQIPQLCRKLPREVPFSLTLSQVDSWATLLQTGKKLREQHWDSWKAPKGIRSHCVTDSTKRSTPKHWRSFPYRISRSVHGHQSTPHTLNLGLAPWMYSLWRWP